MEGHRRLCKSRVYPTITGFVDKAIILDEIFGDVGELYVGVFKSVEWGVEEEVADIKASKSGISTRENTVEDYFGEFKGAGWRANVDRIANTLAIYGDVIVIGIVLL